ncbi:MAG TPA: CBS domain-containing protein, partial [Saprospiraceae bacterium]|nr:CBS domain-containing protein [Saprospiraceae bacterium]
AIALLTERGFTDRDFARYHPGGNLGKQLYTCVKDICRFNNQPWVNINAGIKDIIVAISSGRLGVTAVKEGETVMGVITDGDLRRMLEKEMDLSALQAKDIMTHSPKTIQGGELAINALHLLKNLNITQLLVMEGQHYIGVIHIHDLLKEGFV